MTSLHDSYRACKQKHGSGVARELLLVTYQQCKSIKQTAREWKCSKNTVRLAITKKQGNSLKDESHVPHKHPDQTPQEIEDRVCQLRKETGYGKVRLQDAYADRYGQIIPESTIGKIITRNKLPAKVYRSAWRRKTRRYYDKSTLIPFERNEVDVKEILDKKGLPQVIYEHFASTHLPLYQWTWIDVASRVRFIAYSYQCTWSNGQTFFRFVTAWLRMFGVTEELLVSIDGGREWHANLESCFEASKKSFYLPLGVNPSVIRRGHPEDNAYVERSHRTDDEECYVPLGLHCKDEASFLKCVQWWHSFYNTQRRHQGISRKTPITVLQEKRPGVNPAIAHFIPIILDRHFQPFSTDTHVLLGGQNVLDYYQIR